MKYIDFIIITQTLHTVSQIILSNIHLVLLDAQYLNTKLTDSMINELAKCFPDDGMLRSFAIKRLKMARETIQAALRDNLKIESAAYAVLTEWDNSQPCKKEAYQALRNALFAGNLGSFINKALNVDHNKS